MKWEMDCNNWLQERILVSSGLFPDPHSMLKEIWILSDYQIVFFIKDLAEKDSGPDGTPIRDYSIEVTSYVWRPLFSRELSS